MHAAIGAQLQAQIDRHRRHPSDGDVDGQVLVRRGRRRCQAVQRDPAGQAADLGRPGGEADRVQGDIQSAGHGAARPRDAAGHRDRALNALQGLAGQGEQVDRLQPVGGEAHGRHVDFDHPGTGGHIVPAAQRRGQPADRQGGRHPETDGPIGPIELDGSGRRLHPGRVAQMREPGDLQRRARRPGIPRHRPGKALDGHWWPRHVQPDVAHLDLLGAAQDAAHDRRRQVETHRSPPRHAPLRPPSGPAPSDIRPPGNPHRRG